MKFKLLSFLLLLSITFSSCAKTTDIPSSEAVSEESSSEISLPENEGGNLSDKDETGSSEPSSVSSPQSSSKEQSSFHSSSSSPISSSEIETNSSNPENEESDVIYLPKEEIKTFYGYGKLSETEKSAYAVIYNSIQSHDSEANIRDLCISKGSLKNIMSYLFSDHAELIGLSKQYNYIISTR